MFFSPCVNVQASLKRLDATGLERLNPVPTLTAGTIAGDPLLSVRIFDCLSFLRRDLPRRQDFLSHSSYLVQVVNTEGLPLVPLQTAKCLPVVSATGNLHHGANLSACEINVPLDLSRAPLLAAPKGRITLLLFSLSGRPLITSDVQLESATVAVQQDTSLSSWLLVFSYLPIVFFTGIIILFLPSQSDHMTTFSNYHF
ncbi:unnamed protein product [Dibothriocephalus latus]|uniref:Uncharacterized protein n=1 Tax=Dibothriocephalus latus TaxID=60516 RepID=A0A3P6QJE6_DIBLA|nr:unnamed protein product [Dibothriocephalus latus]